jgi:hypothetical protein
VEHRTHPARNTSTGEVVLPDGPTAQVEATAADRGQMPALCVYARPADADPAVAVVPGPASSSELLYALASHAASWARQLEETARTARETEDALAQLAEVSR